MKLSKLISKSHLNTKSGLLNMVRQPFGIVDVIVAQKNGFLQII